MGCQGMVTIVIWYLNETSKMDKPFLGCGVAKFCTTEQQGQLVRAMGSTPIIGRGRGLWRWSEVMPEGVPPVGSPPDSPKVTREPMGRPMEDTEVAREVDSPSETAAVVDLDKMPPLKEDEAIAELDAAIDEAGDEGEEGPKPLDKADISEVAHCIKDDPMLHLALGLTEPYWASMALVVGVWKLHEYEVLKNNQRRSQVLSYGRLADRYSVKKDQLQEVSSWGSCSRDPRSARPNRTRGWWCLNSDWSWKAIPPPPDRTPHRCTDTAQNSWSFSGPQLCSQSKISFEKVFL